jgi:hypothetical protein
MDKRDNNTHDTIDNMWARGMPVRTGGRAIDEVRMRGDFIDCPNGNRAFVTDSVIECDGLIKFDTVRMEPGMALDQSGVFIDARCSKCSFAGQLGILNQQVRDDEFLGRLVWVYKVETANDERT